MALPPSEAGADHDSATWVLPALAARPLGAEGAVTDGGGLLAMSMLAEPVDPTVLESPL